MGNPTDLTGEILAMTCDNTDGTSRQAHALYCRPGDELVLVPLPGAAHAPAVIAVLSLSGHQLGQLPVGIAEQAGAGGTDARGLSSRWICRVMRVIRQDARLRTIVRLEERPAQRTEPGNIGSVWAAAEGFLARRMAMAQARDQAHVPRESV